MENILKGLLLRRFPAVVGAKITGRDLNTYYGSAVLDDGFMFGFVFTEPDYLSFTMSDQEIKERHNIYINTFKS